MAARPLSGVRVADFTWVIAGPMVGRTLVGLGAEVIKVESPKRLDIARVLGPHPDLAPAFTYLNAGKLGVSLDLSREKGRELARKLCAISDVVLDNYSPRVMAGFGLDWPRLSALNPRLIQVSLSGMGVTGPQRDYVSYGPSLQPLAGHTYLTGFPGERPAGTSISYPDFLAGMHGALAVIAALDERERSGRGQFIDLSQFEAAAAVLETILLDYEVNGRVREPQGNTHRYAAPHNAYQTLGDDRWITIAVFDDAQWDTLCMVMGQPAWTRDPRFATVLSRHQHRDELDPLVEAWTREQDGAQLMAALQARGVPAGVVQDARDLLEDRHLRERGHYQPIRHRYLGEFLVDSPPIRLSETPYSLDGRAGPLLGEHNAYVFGELLGLTPEAIAAYEAQGVIDAKSLPPVPATS